MPFTPTTSISRVRRDPLVAPAFQYSPWTNTEPVSPMSVLATPISPTMPVSPVVTFLFCALIPMPTAKRKNSAVKMTAGNDDGQRHAHEGKRRIDQHDGSDQHGSDPSYG